MFVILKRKIRKNCKLLVTCTFLAVLWSIVKLVDVDYKKRGPECWFPGFNVFETNVYEKKRQTISCYNASHETFIKSNKSHLCPIRKNMDATCSWIPFRRRILFGDRFGVEYVGEAKALTECTSVRHEFVEISCSKDNEVVYKDYRYFIPPARTVVSKKMSVIVVGIEGLSRENFKRQLPVTTKALINGVFNAIEFEGFAPVSIHAFNQWMGLLSDDTCHRHWAVWNFTNCKLLWSAFKKDGYHTAYGDDDPNGGSLKAVRLLPCFRAVDHLLFTGLNQAVNASHKNERCFGSVPSYRVLFNYAEKFMEANRKHPHFGLFVTSKWTRNQALHLYDLDEALAQFVGTFEDSNSILVLMSDCGTTWEQPPRQTYWGARLPALFVVTPTEFKLRYPLAYNNLLSNKQQLITVRDLHDTIDALRRVETVGNAFLASAAPANAFGPISLFRRLERQRNCSDVHLRANLCPCQPYESVSRGDPRLLMPTHFVLSMLNRYNVLSCPFFALQQIEEAYVTTFTFLRAHKLKDFLLTIRTKPHDVVFKATVRCEHCDSDFQLILPVRAYTANGEYVDCEKTEQYCYCPTITADN